MTDELPGMPLRSGATILALLALAGCSLAASPADGLTFKPPAGWSSSPGIMGFMQFWRPSSTEREVLMLFKSPTPLKPTDVFKNSQVNGSLSNVAIERQTAITICGKQPAALRRGARHVEGRGRARRDGADERRRQQLPGDVRAARARPVESERGGRAARALREALTVWREPAC